MRAARRLARGALDDLLHRSLQGAQKFPLGLFGAGLDVPLPNVVDQALDCFVELLPQQPRAERFDLDDGVRIDAFTQALLAVAGEADVADVDVVGGAPARDGGQAPGMGNGTPTHRPGRPCDSRHTVS